MATHFSPEALKFLRGLARNNNRDWFSARKAVYEQELKAPMLALIEEINGELIDFAPEHIDPHRNVCFASTAIRAFLPTKHRIKSTSPRGSRGRDWRKSQAEDFISIFQEKN